MNHLAMILVGSLAASATAQISSPMPPPAPSSQPGEPQVHVPAARVAPLPAGEHWRLVFPGRVEAIEGSWERTAPPAGLAAVWYWSENVAPMRLKPAELARFAPPPASAAFVHRRKVAPIPAGAEIPPAQLIAGPIEIWREVPEELLPRWPWPAAANELHLPRNSRSEWQIRLLDGAQGTYWLSPPRSAGATDLQVLPASHRAIAAVDAAGEPLPELTVELLRPGSADLRALMAIYRDGGGSRVVVPSLPDGEPIVAVIKSPGFVPLTWQGLPASLPARFRLEVGSRVAGRLVDGSGNPAVGVEVLLETWLPGDFPSYLMRGGKSAADGRFSLEAVPPGAAKLLTRSGFFAELSRSVEVRGRDLDLGVIELSRGRRLALRILDEEGRTVAGARVLRRGLAEAVSDVTGSVAIEGVHPDQQLELEVEAEGFLAKDAKFFPPFPPVSDVRLAASFSIEGVFLDEDGRPVVDGRINASDGRRILAEPFAGAGSFSFNLPVDAAFELRLLSASGSEVRLALEKGRPGERRQLGELRAQPARRIFGRLVSARDGLPVAGGRAWLPRPGQNHEATAFLFGDLLEANSQADGTFEMRGLPPGSALLRIDAPGFARKSVLLPTGEERDEVDLGDLALDGGAELEVAAPSVRDGAAARLDLGGRWLELDTLSSSVYDGVAVFRQVPAGRARLTVVDAGKLLCEKEIVVPDSGRVAADCDRASVRVAGQVTLGGRLPGAGRLVFSSPGTEAPQIIHRQATPGGLSNDRLEGVGRPSVEVPVGPDGYFVSEDLLPGPWKVGWIAPSGSFAGELEVEIADLEETVVHLDFPYFRVAGQVLDRDGHGIAGARVRESRRGLLTFSGSGGKFEMEGLEAGESWLVAEMDDERSRSVQALVAPDGSASDVRLVIGEESREGKIAVQVLLPGQEAAAAALVFLETADGTQTMLSANGEGKATFELERPFPTYLRIGAFAGGRLGLGDFQRFSEDMPPLQLQIGETGTLRLLAAASGRPALKFGQGWDVAWWLGRLGRLPMAQQGEELAIEGLPAGSYQGDLSGHAFHVEISAGEVARVEAP